MMTMTELTDTFIRMNTGKDLQSAGKTVWAHLQNEKDRTPKKVS
jgi:hypothetical protein